MSVALLPEDDTKAASTDRIKRSATLLAAVGRAASSGSTVYLAVSILVNLTNFLYHVLYSRNLGPGIYSGLSSLLGIIVIVGVPLSALQLAVAQAQSRQPVSFNLRPALRTVCRLALGLLLVGFAVAPAVDSFLHLHSMLPFDVLALYLAVSAITVVPAGALLGQRRLRELAISMLAGTVVFRLALGVVLASAHQGILGAMIATAAGSTGSLVLALFYCRSQLTSVAEPLILSGAESKLSFFSTVGLAIIGVVDTVLARHILDPVQAGYYLISDTTGRIALFAPSAIALVMFPRFSAAAARGMRDRKLMLKGLGSVAGSGGFVVVLLSLFPTQVLQALYGHAYTPGTSLMLPLSIEGAMLGCLNLMAFYHLAMGSKACLIPWVGAIIATALVLSVRPHSMTLAELIDSVFVVTLLITVAAGLFGRRTPIDPIASANSGEINMTARHA